MNTIFFLAFVLTFLAIGVGAGIYFAEKSRDIDADIARFVMSIPPEAFEPDELWAAQKLPADTRRAPARRPAQRAFPPFPPSGVGGNPLYGPHPRPNSR